MEKVIYVRMQIYLALRDSPL